MDEGDPGDGALASFTVSLSVAPNRPVTVAYQTAEGSAVDWPDDHCAARSVSFAPGEVDQPMMVPVAGYLLD